MRLISDHAAESLNGAPYAIVDACVSDHVEGNPAAVVPLDGELPTSILLQLAQQLDEPVTAFVTAWADSHGYGIRWFTRNCELRICGHATLAASEWMLATVTDGRPVEWHSKAGVLMADRVSGKVRVSFPETRLHRMDPKTVQELTAALGTEPRECLVAGDDYLVVLDAGEEVTDFKPRMTAIERLSCRGVIVTAEYSLEGEHAESQYDIVSRFFAPRIAIPEDEVCVSAHCALYPYWSEKLGHRELKALQASSRGGVLELASHSRERVSITGECRVRTSGTWSAGAVDA